MAGTLGGYKLKRESSLSTRDPSLNPGESHNFGEIVSTVTACAVFVATHVVTWLRGIRKLEQRLTKAETAQTYYAEKTETWQNNLLATLKDHQQSAEDWRRQHESEADTRDSILVEMQVLCKSIDTTVQLTTKRMDAFDEWVRNHDKWAAGKIDQMNEIAKVATTQAEI